MVSSETTPSEPSSSIRFAAIHPHNVRDELNLLRREVAMRSVDLTKDVAGIDEQHLILARPLHFALIEEPEGGRQSDRVEEVRPDRDDHVDRTALDQFLPDLQLRPSRVGGRVCHDEPRATLGVQRGVEELYPEVVRVVRRRQTEGEPLFPLQTLAIYTIHVERRIGHCEVELTEQLVWIVVVGVRLLHVARQTMHCEVHAAHPQRLADHLGAVDRQLLLGGLVVMLHELRRVDKHAAGAASGVEDLAVVWLDDLDDQLYDAGGGVELATLLHLVDGEVAHEVLVDLPESVPLDVERLQQLHQLTKNPVGDRGVGSGEHVLEVRIGVFDGPHGIVQCLAEVVALGQRHQSREAGLGRQVHDAPGLVVGRFRRQAALGLRGKFLVDGGEPSLGVTQEQEAEDGSAVLGGPQSGVRPEAVSSFPEAIFEFLEVDWHDWDRGGTDG